MNVLEDLGWDRDRKPSSLQLIKHGPNRGRRRKEPGGSWAYMSGHLGSEHSARHSCHDWSVHLHAMGFRIGKLWDDGVTSYYLWRAK